jgi:hypothetical protein
MSHRPPIRHRAILHPLSAIVVLLLSLPALAQTSVDLMLKPFSEKTPIEVNAAGAILASGHTDNAGADYQLSLLDLTARYRFAPDQRIDPRIGVAATYLNFDSKDPAIPGGLLDASVAVGFGVYEDKSSGWQAGLTIGMGYAGSTGSDRDNLFSDGNAWYGKASLLVGKHLNKTDSLLFIVDYDGNRTYKPDIPFPGIAYQKLIFGNPDPQREGEPGPFQPQLLLTLGVPYAALHWEPVEHLTIDVSYLIPDTFSARVDYDLVPRGKLGVFGSLDSRRNGFHSNELRHGDDRILFYQQRAEVGLRWTPAPKVNLLLAGGYAFGQELTTGFDTSNDRKLADLGDRPYVRVGLEVGF